MIHWAFLVPAFVVGLTLGAYLVIQYARLWARIENAMKIPPWHIRYFP